MENLHQDELNNNGGEKHEDVQKKAYNSPVLRHHGGLAELVQLRPARAADGQTRWPDCTAFS